VAVPADEFVVVITVSQWPSLLGGAVANEIPSLQGFVLIRLKTAPYFCKS
jgi:hypothetical protein